MKIKIKLSQAIFVVYKLGKFGNKSPIGRDDKNTPYYSLLRITLHVKIGKLAMEEHFVAVFHFPADYILIIYFEYRLSWSLWFLPFLIFFIPLGESLL